MGIQGLKDSKELRKHGERIGRGALAQRVWDLVDDFNANRSYKNAIALAGRLKAIAHACEYDGYWSEKCFSGYQKELEVFPHLDKEGKAPANWNNWWPDNITAKKALEGE